MICEDAELSWIARFNAYLYGDCMTNLVGYTKLVDGKSEHCSWNTPQEQPASIMFNDIIKREKGNLINSFFVLPST